MNKLFVLLITGLIAVSCTEKIDINLNGTYPRFVVDAKFTTDTAVQIVKLTKSANYSDTLPCPRIRNAHVTITDEEGNTITFNENPLSPGVYESDPDVYGQIGKTYTLHISNVDANDDMIMEEYGATCKINPINSVDSINLEYLQQEDMVVIGIYALDPSTREFYLFKAWINNSLVTDTITEWYFQNDDLFNGNYTNGIGSQVLDQKEEGEFLYDGDTVTFELNSITEEYMQFVSDVQAEVLPKVPIFSGPSANVSTNIYRVSENGTDAVGFFAAYSITRCSTIFHEDIMHKK